MSVEREVARILYYKSVPNADKGEGVKNPKILRTSYLEAPFPPSLGHLERASRRRSVNHRGAVFRGDLASRETNTHFNIRAAVSLTNHQSPADWDQRGLVNHAITFTWKHIIVSSLLSTATCEERHYSLFDARTCETFPLSLCKVVFAFVA